VAGRLGHARLPAPVVRRKELQMITPSIVLFALAAIVALGRFGPYAF
jgi:hypothetical protein